MTTEPKTYFASPERDPQETIAGQHRRLAANAVLAPLLDSYPEPAVLLNRCRQIVLANRKFAERFQRGHDSLLGLRTGEAFACVHAKKGPNGCGTTRFCRYCGGANAIVEAQTSLQPSVQECRVLCSGEDGVTALDLQVRATPLSLSGEPFTVFAVRDTTDEKRRVVLERLFFHDVLNAAATLKGILTVWPKLSGEQVDEMRRMANDVANQLVEEIQAQRDLAAAERGDLVAESEEVDVAQLLIGVCERYAYEAAATGKTVAPPRVVGPKVLRSVPVLLRRVLGNLIKNALEASAASETVSASFENHGVPTFRIHNPAVMAEAVQAQLFQRSFTTKEGSGRGVGTYSVKLFVENYLHGSVGFESTAETGTTFIVTLPAQAQAERT